MGCLSSHRIRTGKKSWSVTSHKIEDRRESNSHTGRLEGGRSERLASLSGCSDGCTSELEHETRSLPLRRNATMKKHTRMNELVRETIA